MALLGHARKRTEKDMLRGVRSGDGQRVDRQRGLGAFVRPKLSRNAHQGVFVGDDFGAQGVGEAGKERLHGLSPSEFPGIGCHGDGVVLVRGDVDDHCRVACVLRAGCNSCEDPTRGEERTDLIHGGRASVRAGLNLKSDEV